MDYKLSDSVMDVETTPLTIHVPGGDDFEIISHYTGYGHLYPNTQPETMRWITSHVQQDWVVFDCGAHVGVLTIVLARLVRQVYSFEPTTTCEMLLANLLHNDIGNVQIVPLALAATAGTHRTALRKMWGVEPEWQMWDFTTVDAFAKQQKLERLDFIKIDVDGFDFEVLQGAVETLERFNPYVLVELNEEALGMRGFRRQDVLTWLAQRRYTHDNILDGENVLIKRDANLI